MARKKTPNPYAQFRSPASELQDRAPASAIERASQLHDTIGSGQSTSFQEAASPRTQARILQMAGIKLDPSQMVEGEYAGEAAPAADMGQFQSEIAPSLREQILKAAKEPTEVDLTPLANFANAMSMSGRKVTSTPSKHTADDRDAKLLGLQKMLQDENNKEDEKQQKLLAGISGMQHTQISASEASPFTRGANNTPSIKMEKEISDEGKKLSNAHNDFRTAADIVLAALETGSPIEIKAASAKFAKAMGNVGAISDYERELALPIDFSAQLAGLVSKLDPKDAAMNKDSVAPYISVLQRSKSLGEKALGNLIQQRKKMYQFRTGYDENVHGAMIDTIAPTQTAPAGGAQDQAALLEKIRAAKAKKAGAQQ